MNVQAEETSYNWQFIYIVPHKGVRVCAQRIATSGVEDESKFILAY